MQAWAARHARRLAAVQARACRWQFRRLSSKGDSGPIPLNIHFSVDDATCRRLRVLNDVIRAEHPDIEIDFRVHLPHLTLFSSKFYGDRVEQIKAAALEAASQHFSGDDGIECRIHRWDIHEGGFVMLRMEGGGIAQGAAAIADAVQEFVHPDGKTGTPKWLGEVEPVERRKRKLFYKRAYGSPNVYEEYEPHLSLARLPNEDPKALKALERTLIDVLGPKKLDLKWTTYIEQLRIDTPRTHGVILHPFPEELPSAEEDAGQERPRVDEELADQSVNDSDLADDDDGVQYASGVAPSESEGSAMLRKMQMQNEARMKMMNTVRIRSHVLDMLLNAVPQAQIEEDDGGNGNGIGDSKMISGASLEAYKKPLPIKSKVLKTLVAPTVQSTSQLSMNEAATEVQRSLSKRKTERVPDSEGLNSKIAAFSVSQLGVWLNEFRGEVEKQGYGDILNELINQEYDGVAFLEDLSNGFEPVFAKRGTRMRARRFAALIPKICQPSASEIITSGSGADSSTTPIKQQQGPSYPAIDITANTPLASTSTHTHAPSQPSVTEFSSVQPPHAHASVSTPTPTPTSSSSPPSLSSPSLSSPPSSSLPSFHPPRSASKKRSFKWPITRVLEYHEFSGAVKILTPEQQELRIWIERFEGKTEEEKTGWARNTIKKLSNKRTSISKENGGRQLMILMMLYIFGRLRKTNEFAKLASTLRQEAQIFIFPQSNGLSARILREFSPQVERLEPETLARLCIMAKSTRILKKKPKEEKLEVLRNMVELGGAHSLQACVQVCLKEFEQPLFAECYALILETGCAIRDRVLKGETVEFHKHTKGFLQSAFDLKKEMEVVQGELPGELADLVVKISLVGERVDPILDSFLPQCEIVSLLNEMVKEVGIDVKGAGNRIVLRASNEIVLSLERQARLVVKGEKNAKYILSKVADEIGKSVWDFHECYQFLRHPCLRELYKDILSGKYGEISEWKLTAAAQAKIYASYPRRNGEDSFFKDLWEMALVALNTELNEASKKREFVVSISTTLAYYDAKLAVTFIAKLRKVGFEKTLWREPILPHISQKFKSYDKRRPDLKNKRSVYLEKKCMVLYGAVVRKYLQSLSSEFIDLDEESHEATPYILNKFDKSDVQVELIQGILNSERSQSVSPVVKMTKNETEGLVRSTKSARNAQLP